MMPLNAFASRKDYDAYHAIVQALAPLHPDERVMVMEWVHDCYCPNCGYPAPPADEDCSTCKDAP